MASDSQQIRRTCLVLDFDGTITESDTTDFIGRINPHKRAEWKNVVDAYISDLNQFNCKPFPWTDYNPQDYAQWLNSRRTIEVASSRRAQDSSIFAGLRYKDIQFAVAQGFENGQIKFRRGWVELLQYAARSIRKDDHVAILSVSWSETFIRQCLREAVAQWTGPSPEIIELVESIEIHANEIQGLGLPMGSSGKTIREPDTDIRTSGDKLQRFRAIIDSTKERSEGMVRSIYVGDSVTDFECLCEADVGIWLCDAAEKGVTDRFNKTFHPLVSLAPQQLKFSEKYEESQDLGERHTSTRPPFFYAQDLLSIAEFLNS